MPLSGLAHCRHVIPYAFLPPISNLKPHLLMEEPQAGWHLDHYCVTVSLLGGELLNKQEYWV